MFKVSVQRMGRGCFNAKEMIYSSETYLNLIMGLCMTTPGLSVSNTTEILSSENLGRASGGPNLAACALNRRKKIH